MQTDTMHESDSLTDWPAEVKSVLVLAQAHPQSEPELDWWDGRNTEGNRRLMAMADNLKKWCQDELNVTAYPLPYHIEKGGVLLKDAAALAGVGIIGRNNLLLTPSMGPRVRLRALFLNVDLSPSKALDQYKPCDGCDMPCLRVCPRKAFQNGSYRRSACMMEMEANRADSVDAGIKDRNGVPVAYIKYCRACELSCIAGS